MVGSAMSYPMSLDAPVCDLDGREQVSQEGIDGFELGHFMIGGMIAAMP